MTDYKKLSSDESGITEMKEIKKGGGSSIENQSLLKFLSKKRPDKLELVDYDSSEQKDIFNSSDSYSASSSSLLFKNKKTKSPMNRARTGNMIMLLYNNNNDPLIVIGPGWPLTLLIMLIIDFISFCFFYFLWNKISWDVKCLGLILTFVQISSYLLSSIMNPGIPPKELWVENYYKNKANAKGNTSYRICKDCKLIIKNTEDIKHCDKCNICIMNFSRHSFLISKCIGQKNQRLFYVFIFSTVILIIYFLFGSLLAFFSSTLKVEESTNTQRLR